MFVRAAGTRITVREDEPVGYPVLHVIAVDKDSRDNGRVTYQITGGDPDGVFSLDYETGECAVISGLVGERLCGNNSVADDVFTCRKAAVGRLVVVLEYRGCKCIIFTCTRGLFEDRYIGINYPVFQLAVL